MTTHTCAYCFDVFNCYNDEEVYCGMDCAFHARYTFPTKFDPNYKCWEWKEVCDEDSSTTFKYNFKEYFAYNYFIRTSFPELMPWENIHRNCKNKYCVNPAHFTITTDDKIKIIYECGELALRRNHDPNYRKEYRNYTREHDFYYENLYKRCVATRQLQKAV